MGRKNWGRSYGQVPKRGVLVRGRSGWGRSGGQRRRRGIKLALDCTQRELEAVRKNEADASRVLVLENLLEDANRMKARYEAVYLAAHREKLMLQANLEEIRSGKSMGDGCADPGCR